MGATTIHPSLGISGALRRGLPLATALLATLLHGSLLCPRGGVRTHATTLQRERMKATLLLCERQGARERMKATLLLCERQGAARVAGERIHGDVQAPAQSSELAGDARAAAGAHARG